MNKMKFAEKMEKYGSKLFKNKEFASTSVVNKKSKPVIVVYVSADIASMNDDAKIEAIKKVVAGLFDSVIYFESKDTGDIVNHIKDTFHEEAQKCKDCEHFEDCRMISEIIGTGIEDPDEVLETFCVQRKLMSEAEQILKDAAEQADD